MKCWETLSTSLPFCVSTQHFDFLSFFPGTRSGGMSLMALIGQGGSLSPILVTTNNTLHFYFRGWIWVVLSQRLCSTLSYKPAPIMVSHAGQSTWWEPTPGESWVASDKPLLGLKHLRDVQKASCLFVSWSRQPHTVKLTPHPGVRKQFELMTNNKPNKRTFLPSFITFFPVN